MPRAKKHEYLGLATGPEAMCLYHAVYCPQADAMVRISSNKCEGCGLDLSAASRTKKRKGKHASREK